MTLRSRIFHWADAHLIHHLDEAVKLLPNTAETTEAKVDALPFRTKVALCWRVARSTPYALIATVFFTKDDSDLT